MTDYRLMMTGGVKELEGYNRQNHEMPALSETAIEYEPVHSSDLYFGNSRVGGVYQDVVFFRDDSRRDLHPKMFSFPLPVIT